MRPRGMIGRNDMEIRTKVAPDLYRSLNREAACEDLTVSAVLRRIIARHYERGRAGEDLVEQALAALAEGSAERQLIVAMLDLMYQGLLVRLAKPEAGELERRIADATDGHRKWRLDWLGASRTEPPMNFSR